MYLIERTPTLYGRHDSPEATPTDFRVDAIPSETSETSQLEEHSLFVLHPMWTDKGDLL